MNKFIYAAVFFAAAALTLYAGPVSGGQQETGEIVLRSLSVAEGKVTFRTDTGGCTDKKSFRVNAKKVKAGNRPHYSLTIERVVPDFCKGFFIEGTVIEIDLEKDAGLKGNYTVSVTNMIHSPAVE